MMFMDDATLSGVIDVSDHTSGFAENVNNVAIFAN
jgi:hypothetical protein